MAGDAETVVLALHAGHEQLAALVKTFTPEQLTGASGADQWDVSQVLSHLGSGAVITRRTLEAALAGQPTPGMEANREVWAVWDAMTPQARADGFLAANAQLLALLDSVGQPTRESLRIDLGFLPEPVDLATAGLLRLNEFALHSWDVRVAFDPAAVLHPQAAPLLLDLVVMMLAWIAKPGLLPDGGRTLLVTLHEPDASFGLVLGESAVIGAVPAEPDGVLTAPAEAWLRLATGRLAPEHTPPGVSLTGDTTLDTLRTVFPGF